MKQSIAKFALYVYLNFIKEDWDEYNQFGKKVIYPAWVVRSILVWIISPLLIPAYLVTQTQTYKDLKNVTLISPEDLRQHNKAVTQRFLRTKGPKGKKGWDPIKNNFKK